MQEERPGYEVDFGQAFGSLKKGTKGQRHKARFRPCGRGGFIVNIRKELNSYGK